MKKLILIILVGLFSYCKAQDTKERDTLIASYDKEGNLTVTKYYIRDGGIVCIWSDSILNYQTADPIIDTILYKDGNEYPVYQSQKGDKKYYIILKGKRKNIYRREPKHE